MNIETKDLELIVKTQQEIATATSSLEELMTLVCDRAMQICAADGSVVEIVEGNELVYQAAGGRMKPYIGTRLNKHTSLSGLSVSKAEVLSCDDSETDPRVNREACRKVGARSMVVVPLLHKEQAIGVLKVSSLNAHAFKEREVNLLKLMASILSSCIGRATEMDSKQKILSSLRQSEQHLQKTTKTLQTMIKASPIGILTLDLNLNVTLWNKSCERMFGWTEKEVLGKPAPYVPEEKRAESNRMIEKMKKTLEPLDIRIERQRKDGSYIKIHGGAAPLTNDEGETFAYIAMVMDITELAKVEQELKAASKAKSEFLANMSHEIRTPINGVIGMTGLLLDSNLNSEQREFTNSIRYSADTLLTLVNDILDFSKIEAGKLALENIEFEVAHLVGNVERTLLLEATKKNLKFTTTIPEDVAKLVTVGDPTRVGQVLTNLVNNAIKFTKKGQVSITVKKVKSTGRKTTLRFEVTDTGIGIPKDSMPQMFKPFSQADTSTTRKFGGTGLGLSISKHLINMMDGEIGVSSKENEGSTFWFTLSFDVANKKTEPTASESEAIPVSKFKNKALRVLIAEDNMINQKIAIRIMEKYGFRAEAVANGREAIEALHAAPYDLILMDCQMPELDGYEATKLIRASKNLNSSNIPIIAITANAMAGDREKCLQAGMDAYITKPVKAQDLIAVVTQVLESKSKKAA